MPISVSRPAVISTPTVASHAAGRITARICPQLVVSPPKNSTSTSADWVMLLARVNDSSGSPADRRSLSTRSPNASTNRIPGSFTRSARSSSRTAASSNPPKAIRYSATGCSTV